MLFVDVLFFFMEVAVFGVVCFVCCCCCIFLLIDLFIFNKWYFLWNLEKILTIVDFLIDWFVFNFFTFLRKIIPLTNHNKVFFLFSALYSSSLLFFFVYLLVSFFKRFSFVISQIYISFQKENTMLLLCCLC